jgi:hypothetical protein
MKSLATEMKSLATEMKSLTTEMKSLTTKMKSLTTETKSLNHDLTTQMKSFVETFFARMSELGYRLLMFFLLAINVYYIGGFIGMLVRLWIPPSWIDAIWTCVAPAVGQN